MLSIVKNRVVTDVSKQTVEIRKMELDWYVTNFGTLATQATVVAGFSFGQLTISIPENVSLPAEMIYIILTSMAMALELYVTTVCTFATIWAPGIALRGPSGFRSVAKAIDVHKRLGGREGGREGSCAHVLMRGMASVVG